MANRTLAEAPRVGKIHVPLSPREAEVVRRGAAVAGETVTGMARRVTIREAKRALREDGGMMESVREKEK